MNHRKSHDQKRVRWLGILAILIGSVALIIAFRQIHPDTPPRNVIVITMDTTRADALGAYGSKKVMTPVLDGLAAHGLVFDQAYSHAPITLPSHTSIMTGLTPPRHGVRNNITYQLSPRHRTLAKILSEHGFATGAFVSSIILDSRFGLDQGFDVYEDNIVHYTVKAAKAIVTRRARTTIDDAIAWLDQHQANDADRPFFSWVHLYDAHAPYDPPLPFKQAYADSLYEGEIAYMDQQIGRLVAHLQAQGLAQDTLIIVTADHGESFGEHGEATHGFFCYGATTHVPLILSQPVFGKPGERLDYRVQGIDIAPTILDWLGLPVPAEFEGKLLSSNEPRAVFSEAVIPQEDFYLAPVHSLKDERYSFYYSSDLELYDLQADPGERKNLAASDPDLTGQYVDKMEALLDAAKSAEAAERVSVDQATIEMLRSLGYVADGGASGHPGSDPFTLPSPHRSVGMFRRLQTLRQFEDVFPFKLIEGLRDLVKEYPDQIILHRDLGRLLVIAGQEEAGIQNLKQAAELQPTDPRLHTFLGLGYHQFSRFDEAIAEYLLALELNPEHTIARYNLALAQLATGNVDEAEANLNTVIEQSPNDIMAMNNLAFIAFHHHKDTAAAQALIQRALAINPNHPLLLANAKRFSGG